jgi:hypothetical protein
VKTYLNISECGPEMFSVDYFASLMCLDMDNELALQGHYFSDIFSYLTLQLISCSELNDPDVECESDEAQFEWFKSNPL